MRGLFLGTFAVVAIYAPDIARAQESEISEPYRAAIKAYLEGRLEEKVINGVPARPGEIPWQVSLGVSWIAAPYESHFCGGIIYNELWILTAAHCVRGLSPEHVVVTYASTDLDGPVTRANIASIVQHPGYVKQPNHPNDIALLKLRKPIKVNDLAKPVDLITPEQNKSLKGWESKMMVSGFGRTQVSGSPSATLQMSDKLLYVEQSECRLPMSYGKDILDGMLCAGVPAGGTDACKADSGGPLISWVDKKPVLAGIVSWGEGCAQIYKWGVYTRVAAYLPWISANTK